MPGPNVLQASRHGKGRDTFLCKKYDGWLQLVWPLIHDDSDRRPSISEVIELLEEFVALEDSRMQKKLFTRTVQSIATTAKCLLSCLWSKKDT